MSGRKNPADFKPPGRPKNDITGLRYGALTVLREDGRFSDNVIAWLCLCECGTQKRMRADTLRRGGAYSCGCLGKVHQREVVTIHGRHTEPVYRAWQAMIARCSNPNHRNYRNYGGRGIRVCERWRDFMAFYADMGDPPRGMSLDRIDNDGGYEPSNCRWATRVDQGRNRRTNRLLTYGGKTQCVAAWSEETGISSDTLYTRLAHRWSVQRTLTTPVQRRQQVAR
jgi:hypothetical protein